MNLYSYSVGDTIESFIGKQEGVYFDLDDSGAHMLVFFDSPTENEEKQFHSTSRFEIRYTVLYDVIMITAKIGNLNWMDAPYSPHLSKNLTKIEVPQEGEGLALTLMLIDSSTGQIKSLRLIGLSEKFSRFFIGEVLESKSKPFDTTEYNKNLQRVYSYSTKEIVKQSINYCKIN